MAILITTAIFALVAYGLAFQANRRFQNETRLPMQWWLTGEVTWSAPRALALGFIPALGIGVLTIHAVLSLTIGPRVGQESLVLPIHIGVGMMFIAIQLLHFWLIAKALRRQDR